MFNLRIADLAVVVVVGLAHVDLRHSVWITGWAGYVGANKPGLWEYSFQQASRGLLG